MKQLIVLLLALLMTSTCMATEVKVKRKTTMQSGGMRMPSITRVTADYENEVITIGLSGYTGGIQVLVSDSQGNVAGGTVSSVTNKENWFMRMLELTKIKDMLG